MDRTGPLVPLLFRFSSLAFGMVYYMVLVLFGEWERLIICYLAKAAVQALLINTDQPRAASADHRFFAGSFRIFRSATV